MPMLISTAYAQATGFLDSQALVQFLPLVLIFVVFYFLLIRPQQRKAKDQRTMLDALRRGDRVVTGGGIIGTVARADNPGEGGDKGVERGQCPSRRDIGRQESRRHAIFRKLENRPDLRRLRPRCVAVPAELVQPLLARSAAEFRAAQASGARARPTRRILSSAPGRRRRGAARAAQLVD